MTAGWVAGSDVFTDLTVRIPGDGLTHVTGVNGSGKSTLVELIAGYLRPVVGSVRVAGVDASTPQARRVRRVCRTRPALFPRMTVRDHLAFASRCAGLPKTPSIDRAEAYGLAEWLGTESGALSTGNARKLWVIMTTLGSPEVVVLDEPYNGLDQHGCGVLDAEIAGWAAHGSVLLVSHTLHEPLHPDHVVELNRRAGVATALTAHPERARPVLETSALATRG